MLAVVSHQGRNIVGRLEHGADVFSELKRACSDKNVRSGLLAAFGTLTRAEVVHYQARRKAYGPARIIEGPMEILSLFGTISEDGGALSLSLQITVSREGDNGIEVIGGHLQAASALACEFVIAAYDDILLRRALDASTGLPLWKQAFEASGEAFWSEAPTPPSAAADPPAEPAQKPKARDPRPVHPLSTPQKTTWDDVAAASESTSSDQQARDKADRLAALAKPARPDLPEPVEEDEDDDELYSDVETGDFIEHPKFGRCVVERIEGDEEYVQVRLRNRNLVRLSLDIIELHLIGHEAGHQVFKAKIAR